MQDQQGGAGGQDEDQGQEIEEIEVDRESHLRKQAERDTEERG